MSDQHLWKFVIELRNGKVYYSDQVIGDINDQEGTIVVVRTKKDGTEYGRATVRVSDIMTIETR